ncbi:MAG: glutathione synthase, partial [bacterium]|nr:glutathione synthase [bacterium]
RQIADWARRQKQGVVLKPLNLSGGRGIRRIKRSSVFGSCLSGRQVRFSVKGPVICQEFLAAAKKGDKRILIWNGNILGAFLRVPKAGEFRANLHQGGKFVATMLTPREIKIAKTVGRWAKKQGLYFIGLDVIGGFLTEINMTSVMGIREVNVLYGKQVEKKIVGDILRRVSS